MASYTHILTSSAPIIDVRSPSEFLQANIPGSINLPILTDDERCQIGICYRKNGQDAAISLGSSLVSGATREERIKCWQSVIREKGAHWLCCARGGLRSQIAAMWLQEAGTQVERIEGGYKALRNHLLKEFNEYLDHVQLVVISGPTGVGKSELLRQASTRLSVLDLERRANHFGSAFGGILGEQPGQATFENALALDCLSFRENGQRICLVEDESPTIGRVALPQQLYKKMDDAPRIVLTIDMAKRVDNIIRDYILRNMIRLSVHSPETAASQLGEELGHALSRIAKRLGGVRYNVAVNLLRDAVALQASSGDIMAHKEWIKYILMEYYDPLYAYSLSKKSGDITYTTSASEALQYLTQSQYTALKNNI